MRRIEQERGRGNTCFPAKEGSERNEVERALENRGFPRSEIAKRLPSRIKITEQTRGVCVVYFYSGMGESNSKQVLTCLKCIKIKKKVLKLF